MTPLDYRTERERRGTQASVAALLRVDPQTISRRERGEIPITHEAAMALLSLPKNRKRSEVSVATGPACRYDCTQGRECRPIRRNSSLGAAMLAAALIGVGRPAELVDDDIEPRESEEGRAIREEREARRSTEAIAGAQARREKREARRLADRERTARQQGRTLEANNQVINT